jgi:hypothetical protein
MQVGGFVKPTLGRVQIKFAILGETVTDTQDHRSSEATFFVLSQPLSAVHSPAARGVSSTYS